MMAPAVRQALPKATDRITLGKSGLHVSPICLGMTMSPETVIAAYDAGVNFFFVTGDLHWPMYDGIRKGLAKLLDGNPSRRDEVVVGVVSYLDNPLFAALQFHEVIGEVPGLQRVDLLIAGAVSSDQSFYPRVDAMARARAAGQNGARAIGATFHQRSLAVVSEQYDMLDIRFIRYNSAHPGARRDLFPYFRSVRTSPVFNFKSTMSQVTPQMFEALNLPKSYWVPDICDYYRFVLTRPEIDGVLCSPMQPEEVQQLARALEKGPLTREEEEYMIWLSSLVHAPVLT
ncbi:MAG TPA: hypothetical protein VK776_22585 [Bryobacteraceae bacterium]|nr:hypothetical protein [Bryobacteraceae bacterium]